MQVWTYWAGPKPPWIDVCLDSMRRRCRKSDLVVLTPETVRGYVTDADLNSRWTSLPPGVGTDCLRACLLAKYGGLWVDADTVLVRDPHHLVRGMPLRLEQFLYSRWPSPPERVIAGYVYSPKGGPVARMWYDAVRSALANAHEVQWGALGERTLTPIVMAMNNVKERAWELPLDTFLPVDIDADVDRYFRPGDWRDYVTEGTVGFGLNYSWMQANRPWSIEPPWGNATLIQNLLRDAERGVGV